MTRIGEEGILIPFVSFVVVMRIPDGLAFPHPGQGPIGLLDIEEGGWQL
jgi:hypothetical protein